MLKNNFRKNYKNFIFINRFTHSLDLLFCTHYFKKFIYTRVSNFNRGLIAYISFNKLFFSFYKSQNIIFCSNYSINNNANRLVDKYFKIFAFNEHFHVVQNFFLKYFTLSSNSKDYMGSVRIKTNNFSIGFYRFLKTCAINIKSRKYALGWKESFFKNLVKKKLLKQLLINNRHYVSTNGVQAFELLCNTSVLNFFYKTTQFVKQNNGLIIKSKKNVFALNHFMVLSKQYNFLTSQLQSNVYKKFSQKFHNQGNSIVYNNTSLTKNITLDDLENFIVLFLRKSKIFNKGRYSRNRQFYRTGVYWCLYLSVILFTGLYY